MNQLTHSNDVPVRCRGGSEEGYTATIKKESMEWVRETCPSVSDYYFYNKYLDYNDSGMAAGGMA